MDPVVYRTKQNSPHIPALTSGMVFQSDLTEKPGVKWVNYHIPGVIVRNSGNISVAVSGTPQVLTFDTEDYDSDNMHSVAALTSRLTCVIAGIYSIVGCVEWAANAAGVRTAGILKNGATLYAVETHNADAAVALRQNPAQIMKLVVGDYVELQVNQTSGGALNAVQAANYSPSFAAQMISY